ncbi:hypothetical protein ADZ37_02735 [Pannonibacter phragmitetus]|nr:hypothetical protein ADZ37_02735 [Pannonibacter phragmitetus]
MPCIQIHSPLFLLKLVDGDEPPGEAKQQEIVAPVVDIDDHAHQGMAHEHRKNAVGKARPRPVLEEQGHESSNRPDHQQRIDNAAEPAIGGEGLEVDVVLVLGEILVELQRSEPEGALHHHLEAHAVAGKAAETGAVIVLHKSCPLAEHGSDAVDGQGGCKKQQHGGKAARAHQHQPQPFPGAALMNEAEQVDEDAGQGQEAPGAAREAEEDAQHQHGQNQQGGRA